MARKITKKTPFETEIKEIQRLTEIQNSLHAETNLKKRKIMSRLKCFSEECPIEPAKKKIKLSNKQEVKKYDSSDSDDENSDEISISSDDTSLIEESSDSETHSSDDSNETIELKKKRYEENLYDSSFSESSSELSESSEEEENEMFGDYSTDDEIDTEELEESNTEESDDSDISIDKTPKKKNLPTKNVPKKKDLPTKNVSKKRELIVNDSDVSTELEETDEDIKEIIRENIEKKAEKLTETAEKQLNSTTTENRRDMDKELTKIVKRTKQHELSSDIVNISRRNGVDPVYFTSKMSEKLMPHQKDGVRFMWNVAHEMPTDQAGGILTHSMGLGKTIQVIAFSTLSIENKRIKNMVIVCPSATMKSVWYSEFKQWCADFDVKEPALFMMDEKCKSRRERENLIRDWHFSEGSVLIISYTLFAKIVGGKGGLGDEFVQTLLNPDMVVLDEGHLVKNPDAQINKAISKFITRKRIILTGTPLQNNLEEYYTMVSLVQKNFWESSDFKRFFKTPIEDGNKPNATPLQREIMKRRMYSFINETKKFTHRRNQSVLKEYLPEKNEFIIYIKMTDFQIDLYKSFLAYINEKKLNKKDKTNFLYNCSILQKIVDHPDFVHIFKNKNKDEEDEEEIVISNDDFTWAKSIFEQEYKLNDMMLSNKMKMLMDILEAVVEAGEKIVVFSKSTKTLDYIEKMLCDKKIGSINNLTKNVHYFKSDGRTSMKNREEYINNFNKSTESRIFLASTKACSLGVNLTGANRLVLFDISWNPTDDQQAMFRIFRFGQSKPVYIYRMVTKDTIEEHIWNRCTNKTWLFTNVIEEKSTKISLKSADLKIYAVVPKNDYETSFDEAIIEKDAIIQQVLKTNVDIAINVMNHESLYVDDIEAISEIDKLKALDEYQNRNKPSNKQTVESKQDTPIKYTGQFKLVEKQPVIISTPKITPKLPPINNVNQSEIDFINLLSYSKIHEMLEKSNASLPIPTKSLANTQNSVNKVNFVLERDC